MTPGWRLISRHCPEQPVLVHKHSRPRRGSNACEPAGALTVLAIKEILLLSAVASQACAAQGDLFLHLSVYLCGQGRFSVAWLLLKSPPLGGSLLLQLGCDEAHKMLCTEKSLRQSLFCTNLAVFPHVLSLLGFSISFTNLDSGLCQSKMGRSGHWLVAFATYFCLKLTRLHCVQSHQRGLEKERHPQPE